MGLSVSHSVIFGIECPRSVFWVATGETRRICSHTINHVVAEGAKFCSECGAAVQDISIEAASERFGAICAAVKEDPAFLFNQLTDPDQGWEWTNEGEPEVKRQLFWLPVSSFHEYGKESIMAIGFRVTESRAWKSSPTDTTSVTLADMATFSLAVAEVAIALSLEGVAKLYFQTELNY